MRTLRFIADRRGFKVCGPSTEEILIEPLLPAGTSPSSIPSAVNWYVPWDLAAVPCTAVSGLLATSPQRLDSLETRG